MSVSDVFRRTPPSLPALTTPGTVVLEAHGVSVALEGRPIVQGLDLEVRSGEVLALVGPNGAGKSTVLGALAGDVSLSSGEVRVDGAQIAGWSNEELAIRRGVMLQQIDVSFPFTVTQVVRMGRSPWASTEASKWDDIVIADAIEEVELGRFSQRVYSSLSGGERARAALARVLAQEPGILLLDEPTAALDVRHQELAFDLARSRANRGDAVVAVVHDLNLAASHADTVAVLEEGRLVATGSPSAVLTSELLTKVYRHPIDVVEHPVSGGPLVLPRRSRSGEVSSLESSSMEQL